MRKGILAILTLVSFGVQAQYFQQEVNYFIEVRLDDEEHMLTAYEEFEYINNSPNSLDKIYIHLWPNAYKNTETALAKQLFDMNDMSLEWAGEEDRGWIDSLDFKVNGEQVKWSYDPEHIDICILELAQPLQPGGSIKVSTPFVVKIPSGDISRLGHVGESYQITQWYPKPAVYDQNGWHAFPYLTQGEFYSEFGSFDVSITLPKNYVVGATGDLQTDSEIEFLNQKAEETAKKYEDDSFEGGMSFPDSENEMKTIRYTQDNVHDFAWFADKRFEVLKGEVELPHSQRVVTTWAMFVPHHNWLWEESIEYLNDGTYYYSLWNGDYPYNNVTAVDGTISAGGGMEYPNVTVIGNSSTREELEVVIVHEVGHNWFYGILGSNERDHAWMDEGLNTLNEIRYIKTKYPKNTRLSDYLLGMADALHLEHLSHHDMNDITYSMSAAYGMDQPIELSSGDYSMINYGAIVYSKTGLVFTYLRDYLGDSLFDASMQEYYNRWSFKHPQPADLRAALEETSGKDLGWLFDDIIPTTKKIDYKITKVKMGPDGADVTVKNVGDVEGPVRVDGFSYGKIRETQWVEPGQKKATVHFESTTLDQFVIDKEKQMPDLNRNNNYWHKKGLFKRTEPFTMEFLIGDNEPDKWNSWWTPAMGYNVYDKFQIGLLFHNMTLPKNKFEYTLAPMFSVGRKNVSGFGRLEYSWSPYRNFSKVSIGLEGKTYGNGLGALPADSSFIAGTYYAVNPYVRFNLGRPAAKKYYNHNLEIKGAYVQEYGTFYSNTLTGGYAAYNFNWHKRKQSFGTTVRFDYMNYNTKVGASNDVGDVLNALVELKYELAYWHEKDKNLQIRVFLGQNLMYNGVENARYGIAMAGQSGTQDVFYEHTMIGRNRTSGMYANQRIENHGGFKSTSNFGITNSMLVAGNFEIEVPYLPLVILYADYGMVDMNGTMESVYDAGAGIKMGNLLKVYFPFLESANIVNAYPAGTKYGQKIRFTLNIGGFTPGKALQFAM